MRRRHFLQLAASAAAGAMVEHASALSPSTAQISLRIAPVAVELAPGIVVRTTGYNGQAPGPVLRMREGRTTTVSITNATAHPERLQWHGLGNSDPGWISPGGGTRTFPFSPTASGARWYRSGTHSGQSGFLMIDPLTPDGDFDREIFLAIHHWEDRYTTFNDKLMGAGEPLRVRAGERVLFHFLNGGANETMLHLPAHRFTVVALDGNPVPRRAAVDVLSLAVGERVDAIVEMTAAGHWLLASVDGAERARGLGVVVEYANQKGPAQWRAPKAIDWSYAQFHAGGSTVEPDQLITVLLERGPDTLWSYPNLQLTQLQPGNRYRLRMMNATAGDIPVHLHGHRLELTRVRQMPVSGIFKDTLRLERYSVLEADLVFRTKDL